MDDLPVNVRSALSAFAAWLRESYGDRLQRVALFGSYARREAVEGESDVDVAVVLDDVDAKEMIAIATQAARLGFTHSIDLKPLILDRGRFEQLRRGERRLAMDIEREGIPL